MNVLDIEIWAQINLTFNLISSVFFLSITFFLSNVQKHMCESNHKYNEIYHLKSLIGRIVSTI